MTKFQGLQQAVQQARERCLDEGTMGATIIKSLLDQIAIYLGCNRDDLYTVSPSTLEKPVPPEISLLVELGRQSAWMFGIGLRVTDYFSAVFLITMRFVENECYVRFGRETEQDFEAEQLKGEWFKCDDAHFVPFMHRFHQEAVDAIPTHLRPGASRIVTVGFEGANLPPKEQRP